MSLPNGVSMTKSVQFNFSGCVQQEPNATVTLTIPEPSKVLFPRNKIKRGWRSWTTDLTIGCGLINLGNSCYINATLQVLFHTPAFLNWLVDEIYNKDHKQHCERNYQLKDLCSICPMTQAVLGAYNKALAPVKPTMIYAKLQAMGINFGDGRQQDAHEFLWLLLESMERSYLAAIGGNGLDYRSKQTTPLGQIFGGYLRAQVRCLSCQYISTTLQPLAELQLDIRDAGSVEDAIGTYFQFEGLNRTSCDYVCERCQTAGPATKQQFLELAPIVLCVQLKRFSPWGLKIDKAIFVNERLSLGKFMYNRSHHDPVQAAAQYKLVGLMTQVGPSPNYGHYTAIAQASNGNFYHFDDAYVHQVSLNDAQNANAYVIFYEMVDPSPHTASISISSFSFNSPS